MDVKKFIYKLTELNFTISSCESFTGGFFCSSLTNIPGSSSVVAGALVTYMTRTKIEIAEISNQLIQQVGVVSKEVAIEMAKFSARKFKTNIGIGFTGVAGPTVLDEKQVGEFYIGYWINGKMFSTHKIAKDLSREELKSFAINTALNEIYAKI
ncbi:nicotinamide-nucleotide amidohydrolase family protein [Spiroplasma endosymbiont of Labia minor]|uniref:CinA family protein n=1 Tax=Spiroplasma endosymbiont of Labia minor TaxID=3066305 RepID=UPI0030D42B84